jgi:cytochrome c oxidase assembly factor CtaG
METGPIIYQWHFDTSILVLAICIVYLYYKIAANRRQKDVFCFWTAICLFLLLEFSPLHFLGMHYYFSAHMITHVIVLLICGPLFVISIPNKNASPTPKNLQILSFLLYKHAWLAWFAGVGLMWFWHIPVVFDASFTAMNNHFSIIPLLHAGSMLIAGMLFSWPLFGPFKNYHIHPLSGIVYLFTACTSCSLLGLLIAFAPLNTFHYYTNLSNSMNMGGLNPWGLSVKSDQQAAGLIMWVPCCFVYLTACIYLLQRWFRESAVQKNNQLVKLNISLTEHD